MGLNKLLWQQSYEKHGIRRELKRLRRRDRLEKAARRKSRGRPAGDSLDGQHGQGGCFERSESVKKRQAPGERPLDFNRSNLGEAAQDTVNGRPVGRARSSATRGGANHPRWDV